MSFVHPLDPTPRATAVVVTGFLVGLTSVITCIALVGQKRCDGQSNVDNCGDVTTRPYFALGWTYLLVGLCFALVIVAIGVVYRDVIITRRYAERAALPK